MRFWKLSGAGNDFVLVTGKGSPALARELCDRREGVGADGLLAVEKKGPTVTYYNADGSRAFCGNGSRCAAWWLSRQRWVKGREFSFLSNGERLQARLTGPASGAVRMPAPRVVKMALKLSAAGRSWRVHWLDTGVPHAVVEVRNADKAPVVEAGRALRFHRAFGKPGANVDFVEWGKPLKLRTYERGVEDETLACGTGVVAAAVAAVLLGKSAWPVKVRVKSGDTLTTSLSWPGGALEAWLEGPVRLAFEGSL